MVKEMELNAILKVCTGFFPEKCFSTIKFSFLT